MNTSDFNTCLKCKQLFHRTILFTNSSKKTCLCCKNCEIILCGAKECDIDDIVGFIYKNYCINRNGGYIYFFEKFKTDYSTFLKFNDIHKIYSFGKDLSSIEAIIYLIKFIDNLEFL